MEAEKLLKKELRELKHKQDFETMASLSKGDYFGEVAIVTNLKRTASVKAIGNSYCMKINPDKIKDLKENFPHIIDELKNKARTYDDIKMNLKRKYLKNVPWL